MNANLSFQGGMQIHAVPDDERATDSRGQRMPWGYSYADASLNRKLPIEKGPFGKTTNRRSLSRSKTATPSTKEDLLRLENNKVIDDIFGRAAAEESSSSSSSALPLAAVSTPAPADAKSRPADSPEAPPTPSNPPPALAEPTEVILAGFLPSHQPLALSFYETASGGAIYEDYDRAPTTTGTYHRFATLPSTRRAPPRSLPAPTLRKINTYRGGAHWIKVTFDSAQAAARAVHASPHVLAGHEVSAELYRGVDPLDVPVLAGRNGASTNERRLRSAGPGSGAARTLPGRLASAPSLTPSLDTASEGTASVDTFTEGLRARHASVPGGMVAMPPAVQPPQEVEHKVELKPLRVRGATRAMLRPAQEALLPVAPWSQRTLGGVPLVGGFFGGNAGATVIGGVVPRLDDGSFDWEKASLWWRVCFVLDTWLGWDLCGVKAE